MHICRDKAVVLIFNRALMLQTVRNLIVQPRALMLQTVRNQIVQPRALNVKN